MASILLQNVTLSYPILGSDRSKVMPEDRLSGAGSLIRDDSSRTRSVVALENVSLELKDGDRLGLIGRNGSGKSTLLRVIGGVFEPLEGYLRVEGQVAGLYSLGLGIQPEATGYKNILISGLMAGFRREEVLEKLPEIIDFCELGEYLDMPVRTYSNGMAMRLKFACATAFNADILLMDEWLGAGDPQFQDKAQKRLRKLVDEAGIMILASHNHSVIQQSCNKAAWLDRGQLRAFGAVEDVLDFYKTAHMSPEEIAARDAAREAAEYERRVEASRARRREAAREAKREEIREAKREEIREAKREEIRRERRIEASRERRREEAREAKRKELRQQKLVAEQSEHQVPNISDTTDQTPNATASKASNESQSESRSATKSNSDQ